eukprot:1146803-Pelagomonas_calceolata.AAC.4
MKPGCSSSSTVSNHHQAGLLIALSFASVFKCCKQVQANEGVHKEFQGLDLDCNEALLCSNSDFHKRKNQGQYVGASLLVLHVLITLVRAEETDK